VGTERLPDDDRGLVGRLVPLARIEPDPEVGAQPVVAAVVDFDPGGRFACELADVDPDGVAIGSELEMTFRRRYVADGIRNYFWKARPRR